MPQSECESLPQPCARASLILVKAMRDGRSWMLVVGVECAGVTVHHAMFWHSNFIFMENRAALELLGIYACAAGQGNSEATTLDATCTICTFSCSMSATCKKLRKSPPAQNLAWKIRAAPRAAEGSLERCCHPDA